MGDMQSCMQRKGRHVGIRQEHRAGRRTEEVIEGQAGNSQARIIGHLFLLFVYYMGKFFRQFL
jgi:hypothetical protein